MRAMNITRVTTASSCQLGAVNRVCLSAALIAHEGLSDDIVCTQYVRAALLLYGFAHLSSFTVSFHIAEANDNVCVKPKPSDPSGSCHTQSSFIHSIYMLWQRMDKITSNIGC